MFKRIIVLCCLLFKSECVISARPQCLTGHMTEVQPWVDDKGALTLTNETGTAIDLTLNPNPVTQLRLKLAIMTGSIYYSIKYLSMARCNLTMIPKVFQFKDLRGQQLSNTLEYVTFYGNSFSDISPSRHRYDASINATDSREALLEQSSVSFNGQTSWSRVFKQTKFTQLKELDLRACFIQILGDHIFEGMTNLKALYLGENKIIYINAYAFVGLNNLVHLDLSKNQAYDENMNKQAFTLESMYVFEPLKKLLSLDLSYTKLLQHYVNILRSIGPKLMRLSLCKTSLTKLEDGIFNKTSLQILDLSGNYGIFGKNKTLAGLEKTLQFLYARDTGLRTMYVFDGFEQLEVLDVSVNQITVISPQVTKTLKSLKILDLDINRMKPWFSSTFSFIPNLSLLSLRDNDINLISVEMITDIARVKYLAMSGNYVVCNCRTRDFFDLALHNEEHNTSKNITGTNDLTVEVCQYHRGYIDFNLQINERNTVTIDCKKEVCYDFNEKLQGKFLLLDFYPNAYMCIKSVAESKLVEFSKIDGCDRIYREVDYDDVIENNFKTLYILFTIPVILLLLVLIFIFRRCFRYCLITLKNSALLSMIHNSEYVDDDTIFHYDVFVSYCNDDRNWVLDHLLPHLESDCSFSACLHERDFQVGQSIFENIVSCMDRSRSIMLIISRNFLLSQWCQFEMHLAQHRLLETRREDLTLVLLEEVPRRLRPNTLHYLMMTKTYIVWPKTEAERGQFWKRIRKTLVTIKQRSAVETFA